MKIMTIQNKKVIEHLMSNEIYKSSHTKPKSDNLKYPYQILCNHYGFNKVPIFGCIVGQLCNFFGARTEDAYILTLDVPDEFCKVMDYYAWSDFVYYCENPDELESGDLNSLEQEVLDKYNSKELNSGVCYQVVLEYIDIDWVKSVRSVSKEFKDKYIGNGGLEILKEFQNDV